MGVHWAPVVMLCGSESAWTSGLLLDQASAPGVSSVCSSDPDKLVIPTGALLYVTSHDSRRKGTQDEERDRAIPGLYTLPAIQSAV